MEGKIFGIPLVLIFLIIVIVALINVPMIALHSANMAVQKELLRQQLETQIETGRVRQLLEITPSPTVTPSVSPTPTRSIRGTVTTQPSSSSAR